MSIDEGENAVRSFVRSSLFRRRRRCWGLRSFVRSSLSSSSSLFGPSFVLRCRRCLGLRRRCLHLRRCRCLLWCAAFVRCFCCYYMYCCCVVAGSHVRFLVGSLACLPSLPHVELHFMPLFRFPPCTPLRPFPSPPVAFRFVQKAEKKTKGEHRRLSSQRAAAHANE